MTWSTKISRPGYALVCAVIITSCMDSSTEPLQTLSLRPDRQNITLDAGSSTKIILFSGSGSLPAGAQSKWETSNAAVATVDQQGVVSAVGAGEATITGTVTFQLKQERTTIDVKVKGPPRLLIRGGGGQRGRVASPLPDPASVLVTDPSGRILPGTTVEFSARVESGSVYQTGTAVSDAEGVATFSWTLGTEAGKQFLSAVIKGNSPSTVELDATALPEDPAVFTKAAGDGQIGTVGKPLPTALRVRVTDQYGNAVPAAAVAWLAAAGTLQSPMSETDAGGYASASWVLGDTPGEQTVAVSSTVGGLIFTATAASLSAARVEIAGSAPTLASIGASTQLSAAAYASGGELLNDAAITWSSLKPQIVSVSASGLVTATANGTAGVVASVNGRADTVTVTVKQVVSRVIVQPTALSLAVGGAGQLSYSAVDAGGTAVAGAQGSWTSSAPSVASVDQNGRVVGIAVGSAQVSATVNGVSSSIGVSVSTATQTVGSVVIKPTSAALLVGTPATFTAEVRDAAGALISNAIVAWSSSNTAAATVSSDGVVTPLAAGSATITASAGGRSAAAQVTITQPAAVVASVTLTPAADTIEALGQQVTLQALVLDNFGKPVSGTSVTYGSMNAAVATVSASGTVTAIATGSAAIVASAGGMADTSLITVRQVPASITVSPSILSLAAGAKGTLTALVKDAGGSQIPNATVIWSSDASAIATVSDGEVTGVAAGTTTVRASSGTVAAQADVTITAAAPPATGTPGATLTPNPLTLAIGTSQALTFTVRDAEGRTLSGITPNFSSSAPQMASVDASGVVLAKKVGVVEITAKFGSYTASSTVTITATGASAPATVTVVPDSSVLVPGDSVKAAATVRDAGGRTLGGATVTWTSSDPAVATVSATGLVRALAAGTAIITATSGDVSGSMRARVAAAQGIASVVASPERDTIKAIGFSRKFSATALDGQGNVVAGAKIAWTSLNPSVATVDADGNVTSKSKGFAVIVAAAAGCSGCVADSVTAFVTQEPATVLVSLDNLSLNVGYSTQLSAVVKDAAGVAIQDATVTWSASPAGVVSVTSSGTVTAVGAGSATVTATSGGKADQTSVVVGAETAPPPPLTAPSGSAAEFIIGPQVPIGASPWTFFDENLLAKAAGHADFAIKAMNGSDSDAALNSVYYDLALVLYELNARSGNATHAQLASSVADTWWRTMPARVGWDNTSAYNGVAPRNASLGGLILYALQGGGTTKLTFSDWQAGGPAPVQLDLWQWITGYVRHHYDQWLGQRLTYPGLYYGIRDGGYMLLYTAWLAKAHPDAAVRDEMLTKARNAARDYYARLQSADGGWYWKDADVCGGCAYSQPFMVGLLLEGMIATHQLTGDAAIAAAITRGVDWLWQKGYEKQAVTNLSGIYWRSMRYFVYEDGRLSDRTTAEEYGMADGAMRDARQLNATTVHAFGYAARLTGDAKYITQGDDVFSATYGKGQGPGSDQYWGLADYLSKQYNQSYRSGGRYLAWRAGS